MESLETRLERFFRTGDGEFEPLALELFARQFALNAPYRAFCEAQGLTPSVVRDWTEVPAVPIQAFRSAELATFPTSRAAAVFQSSGTTQQVRSRHFLKTLRYYETSLRASFKRHVMGGDAALPMLILAPSPGDAPQSSLSWMFEVVKRDGGKCPSDYYVSKGRLDDARLVRTLGKLESDGEAALLLGTTVSILGFVEFCRKSGRRFRLAPGSRLMDTGGMKTDRREITRTELVDLIGATLGIPEDRCINEYGMCELSSQFYGAGRRPVLQGPPWVRTLVIDPVRDRPVTFGESGLLRHFDLANVDSVAVVQTEDLGRQADAGFLFEGRSAGAERRGCSLSAESFFNSAR